MYLCRFFKNRHQAEIFEWIVLWFVGHCFPAFRASQSSTRPAAHSTPDSRRVRQSRKDGSHGRTGSDGSRRSSTLHRGSRPSRDKNARESSAVWWHASQSTFTKSRGPRSLMRAGYRVLSLGPSLPSEAAIAKRNDARERRYIQLPPYPVRAGRAPLI